MEKYFIELLKSNKRLVIPKLGAFLKKEQGGKEVVTFNQFLKFDDGLLVNYIAEQEKTDKEKAKTRVQEIADKITKEINEGNQYKIKGLGSIYKDANGKIQFVEEGKEAAVPEKPSTPAPEKKETTTTTGTPTKKTTSPPPKQTSASKTSVPPQKPKQPAAGSSTQKQADAEKLRQNILNQKKQTQPAGKTPSGSKPTQTPTHKPTGTKFGSKPNPPQSKTTPPRRPTPPPKRPGETSTRQSSSSGGGGKYALWIILALIVLGLGVFFLFFRDKINLGSGGDEHLADSLENAKEKIEQDEKALNKQFEEAKEETEGDSIKEAAKKDTVKKEDDSEPSEEKVEPKPDPKPEGNYFVVAGAFRNKANAKKYLDYLHQKGYNDARIFGMIRDMHAICYDSYQTKSSAMQAMQRIRDEMGRNKAWVYRK
jgi:nucleoid DNA-binding protein